MQVADDDANPEELEAALDALWEQLEGGNAAAEVSPPTDISFSELLLGAWDGFDMRKVALAEAAAAVQREDVSFTPDSGDGTAFDVDDILCAPM